jgi:FMN phosphatase YigB (HAD superfamily)
MKYIFDFDDVLFKNTKEFKEHVYDILEKAGIPREKSKALYLDHRNNFSLEVFLSSLFYGPNNEQEIKEIHEEIMKEAPGFVNRELLGALHHGRLKKDDIYIVTSGNEEFQREKIERSGLAEFFHPSHIIPVPDKKTEAITKIVHDAKGEEVVFIDDKDHHFKDLNDLPNLTTIHYKENTFNVMQTLGGKGLHPEFKKPR